jgi:hypothetical protein
LCRRYCVCMYESVADIQDCMKRNTCV